MGNFTNSYKNYRKRAAGLKGIKSVINVLMQANDLDNIPAADAWTILRDTLSSGDMREGQATFWERRKPRFKGK